MKATGAMRKVLLNIEADVMERIETMHKAERAARPGFLISRADVLRELLRAGLEARARGDERPPG